MGQVTCRCERRRSLRYPPIATEESCSSSVCSVGTGHSIFDANRFELNTGSGSPATFSTTRARIFADSAALREARVFILQVHQQHLKDLQTVQEKWQVHKDALERAGLGAYSRAVDTGFSGSGDTPGLGSNVWGKRQALQDADRDNAAYLQEFLNTQHLLFHPFACSKPAQLVAYKEMTCADHSLENPSTDNWAALDHVLVTTALSAVFRFSGSIFQQMINTRHLPSYGVLSCQYPERSSPVAEPKLDYSHTKLFLSSSRNGPPFSHQESNARSSFS